MTVWPAGFLANDICSALLLPWNEKSQRSSSNDNVQRNMRIENCMTKTILLMTLQTQTAWLELEGCPKLFIPSTIKICLCSGTQIEFWGFQPILTKKVHFQQNWQSYYIYVSQLLSGALILFKTNLPKSKNL